jgi:hypothetical protein
MKQFVGTQFYFVLLIAVFWNKTNMQGQTLPKLNKSTQRVLILGNSIVKHPPRASLGWTGNWGMAASCQDSDFVHLLQKRLLERNPDTDFKLGLIVSFERKFWVLDTLALKQYKAYEADIIILKMGENVSDYYALKNGLDLHLAKLIRFVAHGRTCKIFVVGSFWPNKNTDRLIQKACQETAVHYVDLLGLYDDRVQNTALGMFPDPGVCKHPSDRGMKHIADRIWNFILHDLSRK